MKIGFIGAGGTGKTTVLHLVADRLGLKPLPSVVRGVFEEFGVKQEAEQLTWTTERKWELQKAIFDRRLRVESEYSAGFISDRTILDHLNYCYIRAAEAMTDDNSINLENQVINNLADYTALIFFPAGQFIPAGDGFRQEGRAYQTLQDCFLRGFLCRHRIQHHVMHPGTPELRACEVCEHVRIAKLWRGNA